MVPSLELINGGYVTLQKNVEVGKTYFGQSRDFYQFESFSPWTSYTRHFDKLQGHKKIVNVEMGLSDKIIIHSRVNTIFDVISDIGGFAFCLYVAFSIIVNPISFFEHQLDLIEKLYMARTKNDKIFKKAKRTREKQILDHMGKDE